MDEEIRLKSHEIKKLFGSWVAEKVTCEHYNECMIISKDPDEVLCCPLCKAELVVIGSKSYPEEGLTVECPSKKCDYDECVTLKCNKRNHKMLEALIAAFRVLALERN